MSHIDPTLIAVIVAVVLSIFVIRFLFRPRRPPTVISSAFGVESLRTFSYSPAFPLG